MKKWNRKISILENGVIIDGWFEIGSEFQTQWGFRRVVKIAKEIIDLTQTEPHGV